MSDDRRDLGGPVYLRPLSEQDIDARYIAWFADPDVTRFLDARNITAEESIAYMHAGRETGRYFMFAICTTHDHVHIGNLKVGPIHPRHATSDLVTLIGDRDSWGKGYAREAIRIG
ncbi:MAG: GNAT family N-acetyltransferase, partial [Alphaproteobacteria bacterium]